MAIYNRIHIIGGPGSGKTYMAEELSERYRMPHYDLDDIFWDNSSNNYGNKTPEKKRDIMLKEIVGKNQWVIEGVYYRWLDESFKKSDVIVLLNTHVWVRQYRLIIRYIRRKLGIEKAKNEKLVDFIGLLAWNSKFDSDNMIGIKDHIKKYEGKIIEIASAAKLFKLLEQ